MNWIVWVNLIKGFRILAFLKRKVLQFVSTLTLLCLWLFLLKRLYTHLLDLRSLITCSLFPINELHLPTVVILTLFSTPHCTPQHQCFWGALSGSCCPTCSQWQSHAPDPLPQGPSGPVSSTDCWFSCWNTADWSILLMTRLSDAELQLALDTCPPGLQWRRSHRAKFSHWGHEASSHLTAPGLSQHLLGW